jgi:hypothetical protein
MDGIWVVSQACLTSITPTGSLSINALSSPTPSLLQLTASRSTLCLVSHQTMPTCSSVRDVASFVVQLSIV